MLATYPSAVYRGPAVWVSIKHRFVPRKTEWILAWIMMMCGIVLLHPYETFDLPSYILFKSVMPEIFWGVLITFIGASRLVGLLINGTMRRVTPWIRATSAAFAFFFWLGITFALAFSGTVGWWIAFFPTFVAVEVMNVYQAMRDTGEAYAADRTSG